MLDEERADGRVAVALVVGGEDLGSMRHVVGGDLVAPRADAFAAQVVKRGVSAVPRID
jgi:hypothetical protein